MATIPYNRIIAQLDNVVTIQDYPPGRLCVRLIGVSWDNFSSQAFNNEAGCETFLVDLRWRELAEVFDFQSLDLEGPHDRMNLLRYFNDYDDKIWLDIEYTTLDDPSLQSYAYELFAEGSSAVAQTYFKLKSVQVIPAPSISSPNDYSLPTVDKGTIFSLSAFHVGQGMCSLLLGRSDAFLLDAGAGTPVLRPHYQKAKHANGTPFVNELNNILKSAGALIQIDVILSHPDSDHWKLLDWDSGLLNSVTTVVLPNGKSSLAMSSLRIKPKVRGAGDFTIPLGGNVDTLKVYRSIPKQSDRNGECLVCEVEIGGKLALLAGDYVYSRMVSDTKSGISHVPTTSYDAVVVPHHGDAASAWSIPNPNSTISEAFFSAGNHRYYKHPTTTSRNAHTANGFVEILKNTCPDILVHKLIP